MDQPGMTLLLETDQISVKPQTHIRFAQNFTFEKRKAKKWCFKASYIMWGGFLELSAKKGTRNKVITKTKMTRITTKKKNINRNNNRDSELWH